MSDERKRFDKVATEIYEDYCDLRYEREDKHG